MIQQPSSLMPQIPRKSLTRTARFAYLCLWIVLLSLLGLSIWGAYQEMPNLTPPVQKVEMSKFIGVMIVAVLLATTSLYSIARHGISLRHQAHRSQQDRTAEIAQLAAGLAHEIRNPMHAIRLNLHALSKVDDDRRLKLSPEDHRKLLAESDREIERIEELVRELVRFANPDIPSDETIDVNSKVQALIDGIDQDMRRQEIRIQAQCPQSPVLVRLDADRLHQMLMHLLQNAEQAIQGAGRIDITISQTSDQATIEIADSGVGITESDRDRVFEPFYSTKTEGTGLGLALVRRFVTEANGTITCTGNSPQGTVFRIVLPRVKGPK